MNAPVLTQAWYRHRWPWLLMAGPFIVIVACFVTLWLAIVSNDGLVADDYYKQGLAVSDTLRRGTRGASLGLEARVSMTSQRVTIRLTARDALFTLPPALRVTISHPTRAGFDQTLRLTGQGGTYSGRFRLPAAGHWLVMVEDEAGAWRLLGSLLLPATGETRIGGH